MIGWGFLIFFGLGIIRIEGFEAFFNKGRQYGLIRFREDGTFRVSGFGVEEL